MKENTYYSQDFKQSVVQSVLSGCMSKDEARRRYGIKGKSSVLNWIRKFDGTQAVKMKKQTSNLTEQAKLLQAENKRLREELDLERLRVLSLNVMIDLAEEQFNIPIRKKSGAKQSKK